MRLSVFKARTSKQCLIPSITPYSHVVVHQVCMLLRNVPEAISPNAMQELAVKSDDQSQADLQTGQQIQNSVVVFIMLAEYN